MWQNLNANNFANPICERAESHILNRKIHPIQFQGMMRCVVNSFSREHGLGWRWNSTTVPTYLTRQQTYIFMICVCVATRVSLVNGSHNSSNGQRFDRVCQWMREISFCVRAESFSWLLKRLVMDFKLMFGGIFYVQTSYLVFTMFSAARGEDSEEGSEIRLKKSVNFFFIVDRLPVDSFSFCAICSAL